MISSLLLLLSVVPSQAEDVAAVLLMQGSAQCVCDGASVPAAVGLMLGRHDTLITDDESAVILALSNNHLVRIDEDLELGISDIVMLDAPEIAMDARSQLKTLLYPDERVTMEGVIEAEQIAGWHARMSAGVAPASTDESTLAVEGESDGEMAFGMRGLGLSGVGQGGGGTADGLGLAAPPGHSGPTSSGARPASSATSGLSKRELSDMLSKQGALHTCLVDWKSSLPIEFKKLDVQLRVSDGQIRRVDFGGGLAAPACARDALLHLDVTASESDLHFSVKL